MKMKIDPFDAFEIARSLFPTSTGDGSPREWSLRMNPSSTQEIQEAWDSLTESRTAHNKLRGILLNTGDVTVRRFNKLYFDGNGAMSCLNQQVLLDRVRYGTSLLSGLAQGADVKNADEMLQDIVRDVAVALTGRTITFGDEVDDG